LNVLHDDHVVLLGEVFAQPHVHVLPQLLQALVSLSELGLSWTGTPSWRGPRAASSALECLPLCLGLGTIRGHERLLYPDVRGDHLLRPGELWELVVYHERDVHPLRPAQAHTTLFTFKGKSLYTTSLKTPMRYNLSTTSSFFLLPPSPQPSGRSTRLADKPWSSTCGPPLGNATVRLRTSV